MSNAPLGRARITSIGAKRLALMGLTGALLVLAGRSFGPFGSRAETGIAPATGHAARILGQLEGAELRILVHTSPEGPRYTVVSKTGEVLGAGLSPDELAAGFPGVQLERLHADGPDSEDGW
jgi:hypothetical protein